MNDPARSEPVWLTVMQVKMLHAENLEYFGGALGLRDEALLHSAVDRARNRWAYSEAPSVFQLAAAYAFGIARNRAFVDGNKRTALLASHAFLYRNGYDMYPDEAEAVVVVESLAAGRVDEPMFAGWLRDNSTPL